ncbi:MAG TPA: FHA domain-containing protein [Polyangiaceae bacterium]|nr:FHA domain-containing protein [Polyangiaceae bacterium]
MKMALIKDGNSGNMRPVEPEHYVGRAPNSSLRIDDRLISAQHALLRWTGQFWELRDLGSRNGTYLDGVRLKPGEEHRVVKGMRMSFGVPDPRWELVDDAPPWAMVVPWDGSTAIPLEDDMIALPSAEDPRLTIYRGAGGWVLERPDESITPIANLQTFDVGGRVWRFCCLDEVAKTSLGEGVPAEMDVQHLRLTFFVSRDEENVMVHAQLGGRVVDMGTRAYYYLLLTLARRRLEDVAEGVPETSCGWMYVDDLAMGESGSVPQVNIEVFRLRKHFRSVGVEDAASIVERRPRTRQLRIGAQSIHIVRI